MSVESISGHRCLRNKKYFVQYAQKGFVLHSQFRADSSGERCFADENINGTPIPMPTCGKDGVCLYGK